jgi:hypothetical protein
MLVMPTGAKRISSNYFEYRRRAFPYLWFGSLTLFVVRMWSELAHDSMTPFMVVVAFVALIGYLVVRRFNKDMVDVVWDDGKELIVEKDGEVAHVPIADILKISNSRLIAPPPRDLGPARAGEVGRSNRIHIAVLAMGRYT